MSHKITCKDGYRCAPDGHTVQHFDCGAEVAGKVAHMAVRDGAAAPVSYDPREEVKVEAKIETKAAPKRRTRAKKDS